MAPAVLTVNSLADTVSGTTPTLDLREAVLLVNSGGTATDGAGNSLRAAKSSQIDTSSGAFGANDAIQFAPSLFGTTQQTITLGGTEMLLARSVTITGPGAGQLAVSGNGQSRVFECAAGTTDAISGLTIENGTVNGNGGGLYNSGTLTVTGCTLSGNSVQYGGIFVYVSGGGIYNNGGTMTVTGCTLSGNSADSEYHDNGGGIMNWAGTMVVTGCTLSGNSGANTGGGISNFGTMTVNNSTLSGNTAVSGNVTLGGGIFNDGAMTVTGCTLSGNSTTCTESDSILFGQSAGGGIANGGSLTVTDCTLSDNVATCPAPSAVNGFTDINFGGGIFAGLGPITVQGCTLSNNSADLGGGLWVDSNAPSGNIIEGCIVSGNTAPSAGGGVDNEGVGQALTIEGASGTSLYGVQTPDINSAIFGNQAPSGADLENLARCVLNCSFRDFLS
jgi:hypothetical protein